MNEAQLLDRAADEIDKGWCQCLEELNGDVCAMGAMQRAAFGNALIYARNLEDPLDPRRVAFERAEVVLTQVMQRHFRSDRDIRHMNDRMAGSGREISSCMRRAARLIRMGDIGDNPRRIEVLPETQPVRQPMPEPAPAVPAPVKEPEKVPA